MTKYACHFRGRLVADRKADPKRRLKPLSLLMEASSPKSAMQRAERQLITWGYEVHEPIMCEYNDAADRRVRITHHYLEDVLA